MSAEMTGQISYKTIETVRMQLRELTPGLYDALFRSYDNDEIKTILGHTTDEELDIEKVRYEQGMTGYNRSFVNFLMLGKDTGKPLGRCGFHTWYLQHSRAEIGYAIYEEANKGKGYMKEALKAIVDYGFSEMNLHRIEAFIGSNNTASQRLVLGLGFVKEGCLREHYFNKTKFEDSEVYSLLKSDYHF